jgi:hypothetical protein
MNDIYGENKVNGDSNESNNHLDADYTINKIKDISNDEGTKKNSSFVYEFHSKITGSYFCFDCGAIMTTNEDKKQHELFESHKKTKQDEMDYGH